MKLDTSKRKRFRVSNKVKKVASKDRFRLSITRSSKNISAQIIDDNKNKTDLLEKRLDKQGHKVYSANNGKDALLRLGMDRNEIDVILLDIVMPEMNGFEVLKYIKNDKRFFEIPVIMISSMDDTDSIYRCIENGADDYITKPFDKSILDARISSCIEKKHLRDKEKIIMKELEEEQRKSENLLLNILPIDIAIRL